MRPCGVPGRCQLLNLPIQRHACPAELLYSAFRPTTTTTTDRPNSVPKESPKVSQKGNQSLVFLQPIIVWIRGSFLHFPTLDSKILTYLPQPRVPPFFHSTKTLTSERKKNKDERNYKCKIVKNQSKRRLEYALIDEHTKGAGSAMSTAAHNKCGLGPASRSSPFFGELCCPRLAISRSLWKGNGDPAAKRVHERQA